MMLPQDAHDLASRSFLARRGTAIAALLSDLDAASATVGITSGGAWIRKVKDIANVRMREVAEAAGVEIVNACRSTGQKYRPSLRAELEGTYNVLTENDRASFAGIIAPRFQASPNRGGAKSDAEGALLQAHLAGRIVAIAAFDHFVAQLRVEADQHAAAVVDREAERKRELREKVIVGVVTGLGSGTAGFLLGHFLH